MSEAKSRKSRTETGKQKTGESHRSLTELFSTSDVSEDEAEKHLVKVLEERRERASSRDGWDAAVEGERPPLGRVSFQGVGIFEPQQVPEREEEPRQSQGQSFASIAMKVRSLKGRGMWTRSKESRSATEAPRLEHVPEAAQGKQGLEAGDVFHGVAGGVSDIGRSEFSLRNTDTDRLINAAIAIDKNFAEDDADTASVASEDSAYSESVQEEELPLVGGSSDDEMPRPRGRSSRRKWFRRQKRCIKKRLKKMCRAGRGNRLSEIFHPMVAIKSLFHFVTSSCFAKIGVPCLLIAYFLFYHMGNPTLDFAERATASWWLVFIARQCLTLQLAVLTEFLFIDGLALRTRWLVRLLGPLLTLLVINSRGFPFRLTSWAVWDLLILHGDNNFQQNWLFFLEIPLFSRANRGGKVIESDEYLRALVAMVLVGVTTAVKRSFFALHFGKKTFTTYRARLQKLLTDMALITELAELAGEAESLSESTCLNESLAARKRKGMLKETKWTSVKQFESVDPDRDLGGPNTSADTFDQDPPPVDPNQSMGDADDESLTGSEDNDSEEEGNDGESDDNGSDDNSSQDSTSPAGPKLKFRHGSVSGSASTGTRKIKNLLDRWDEPVDKNDKSTDATISDILKFRKALTLMDDKYPFSMTFGSARTRDECIKNSQRTYRRLLQLMKKLDAQEAMALSFDVINLVAVDEDGSINEAKEWELKRLFRPDRFNEITLLAFVQSIDTVYRRLRYFRASVGNSSRIDKVLEEITDVVFNFILMLVVLTILEINPWPLLVSISTLVVSFAFAVGPSTSKYIEGVLLIAARRPYDLGDRIILCGAEVVDTPDITKSWFVEDINLFSTTLRFAATNEVGTLNNGSIASSRIINCNRSPNALVSYFFQYQISTTADQLCIYREAIDKFVKDRPRIWEQVMFHRCEVIDQDNELMIFKLQVKHTKSWQDAGPILMNKAELLAFCFEVGKKLGINYDQPARTQRVVNLFAPMQESDADRFGEVPSMIGAPAPGLLAVPTLGTARTGSSELAEESGAIPSLFYKTIGIKRHSVQK